MPSTYHSTLSAFTHFLTAYTHTLLYLRHLYPLTSFTRSRFHNAPIHQSRHPLVCDWIRDAVSAVRDELLAGTVSRIGIVVFSYGGENGSQGDGQTGTGSVQIMERYMFDVSRFPVVEKGDRNVEIEWEDEGAGENPAGEDDSAGAVGRAKSKQKALDVDVDVNLSEQFRAALLTLTTRTAQLVPLPPNCSFNISMELKDEGDVDPPIGHPQPWIPVQPSLQKTGRKGAQLSGEVGGEGQDLGGVRVTPVRTVEAGVFKFETWIEEGKAKFDNASNQSLSSSGG
jgi:mitotic spindle assembly checkpoint protein MAD2B